MNVLKKRCGPLAGLVSQVPRHGHERYTPG